MKPPSKPFLIDKRQVYEDYLEVRSKEGAGGVDGVTIDEISDGVAVVRRKGHMPLLPARI